MKKTFQVTLKKKKYKGSRNLILKENYLHLLQLREYSYKNQKTTMNKSTITFTKKKKAK